MFARWVMLAVAVVFACGGQRAASAPPVPAQGAETADAEFEKWADEFYWAHLSFRPHAAIQLGHHRFDGQVPDRSKNAIEAEVARLRASREWLEALDPTTLSPAHQLDRVILVAEVRRNLFELAVLRRPFREPIYYLLFDFSLSPYIDRDYAPLPQRGAALLKACRAAPRYYEQLIANLDSSLSRPALMVGEMMTNGAIAFVDKVARGKMSGLSDEALSREINGCLDQLVVVLKGVKKNLAGRMATATNEFAIGKDTFLRMLSETQGIDADLETLERIGRADLERNLAAITEAARTIDPKRPTRDVVLDAAKDKPEPARVLDEATQQVAAMRAFVLKHDIASIPGTDVAEVRASPPHRRGNFASLSSAGPFETSALPSFYYISPPDPSWPAAEQRAYLPSRSDLLFVSVHEVWPGHFLQGRHIADQGSRYVQSFETYSTSEGWAHYAEEMMWDAGVGGGQAQAHIGLLKNALLRNVRFLVALGMHTGGMTVDEATAMFRDKAFADPGNARQQAMRGTADPMYLSYTLGKLAIMKLRADWEAVQGDTYSLKRFHDTFLRYGEAPLPAIRQFMLEGDPGSVL